MGLNYQIRAAIFRAAIGFGVAALIAAQGHIAGQLGVQEFYAALCGAAAVALTRMAEGVYDGNRDAKGKLNKSDVGYHFTSTLQDE